MKVQQVSNNKQSFKANKATVSHDLLLLADNAYTSALSAGKKLEQIMPGNNLITIQRGKKIQFCTVYPESTYEPEGYIGNGLKMCPTNDVAVSVKKVLEGKTLRARIKNFFALESIRINAKSTKEEDIIEAGMKAFSSLG